MARFGRRGMSTASGVCQRCAGILGAEKRGQWPLFLFLRHACCPSCPRPARRRIEQRNVLPKEIGGQGEAVSVRRVVWHRLPVDEPAIADHAEAESVEGGFLRSALPVDGEVVHRVRRSSPGSVVSAARRLRDSLPAQLVAATHRKPTTRARRRLAVELANAARAI